MQAGRAVVRVYRRNTPQGNFAYMVSNYADRDRRRFDCYATEADALEPSKIVHHPRILEVSAFLQNHSKVTSPNGLRKQKAQQDQANKDSQKILAPVIQLVGHDKAALSALRARQRRIAQNRRVKLSLPRFPKAGPQIKSGWITMVVAPPYNYGWMTGGGLTVDQGVVLGDFSKEKGRLSAGFKLSDGSD